jgi:hypothetical protein
MERSPVAPGAHAGASFNWCGGGNGAWCVLANFLWAQTPVTPFSKVCVRGCAETTAAMLASSSCTGQHRPLSCLCRSSNTSRASSAHSSRHPTLDTRVQIVTAPSLWRCCDMVCCAVHPIDLQGSALGDGPGGVRLPYTGEC